MRWFHSLLLVSVLSGCGLKDLASTLCGRRLVAPVIAVSPSERDCRADAICDIRVFSPVGSDSVGIAPNVPYSLGELSATTHTLRYNTFSAIKEATDRSEYDRTEVACYFPLSSLRVDKTGAEANALLADSLTEISVKCLSGANE